MNFRQLRSWQFTGRGRPRSSRLIEQLAAHVFVPCRPAQAESTGWVPPDGSDDGALVMEVGDRQVMCLAIEQRVVPAAAVKAELQRRVRALATRGGRRVPRAELASLRETILAEFQPRAFSRLVRMPVVIDAEADLVLTTAVSTRAQDRLIGALRDALGSLPLRAHASGRPVPQTMTRWLRGGLRLPAPLAIGQTAVLRDPRNRARGVRIRGAEDLAAEAGAHLADGFEVVELELVWADRLRMRLGEDLVLRSLAMLETEEEGAASVAAGDDNDPAIEFAAGMLVESATLVQTLKTLHESLAVG